jgi:galactokinase
VPASHSRAFAPGRVNLIGEHTDYNQGLALPFAIADGVTVSARTTSNAGYDAGHDGLGSHIHAHALDLGEEDAFTLDRIEPASGWRAFVRGVAAELTSAGFPPPGAHLDISGGVPQGSGLSSSAALEVALCLALLELSPRPDGEALDRIAIARLCARVENRWVGAQTGLLDQLASLYGQPHSALCIDFRTLAVEPVPLPLGDWQLVVLDSGERHAHASSGYNQRRAECARACELLGLPSLRDAGPEDLERLPEPLDLRVAHVLGENQRVLEAVAALKAEDMQAIAELLNHSHESLRDRYQISTPAVEATVERLLRAGASGARMVGGGFGGSVLALFAPEVPLPLGVRVVQPGPGAHLIEQG